jgi:photosystem II stability/assembly factor-like uncharacterized protein
MVLVASAMSMAPAMAGTNRWTPVGPAGQAVDALVAAGGVLYVSDATGLVSSRDGGKHWRPADAGLNVSAAGPAVLTVDPSRSNVLYASEGFDVHRSFDGGVSWQMLPFPAVTQVVQIVIAPSRPRTLYVTACDSGNPGSCSLAVSTDRGASWVQRDLPFGEFGELVVDPADPDVLYLAAERIVRSTDGGVSWSLDGPEGQQLQFVGALAIDPAPPHTVYAAGNAAVGRSKDGGTAWTLATAGLQQPVAGSLLDTRLTALIVDPRHPATLYAAAAGSHGDGIGVFVSVDSGVTWIHMSRGLPRADFNGRLALDASTGILYAGTYDAGLYAFTPAPPPTDQSDAAASPNGSRESDGADD